MESSDLAVESSDMTIEISSVKAIYEGWAKYLVATIRLPDGQIVAREIEDHGTAACVLPYDRQRKTAILVEQFRAPVMFATQRPSMLEAIAGITDEADPMVTARREAFEEAGLQLDTLEPIATAWTMPGISTERVSLFLAPYAQRNRIGAGGGVSHEHERITVREIPLGDLAAMADSERLDDMKTLLLVQTLRLRHPKLFTR
jgi:nudix-type nucleoside diphosphatase (YffH/AdpP family)